MSFFVLQATSNANELHISLRLSLEIVKTLCLEAKIKKNTSGGEKVKSNLLVELNVQITNEN